MRAFKNNPPPLLYLKKGAVREINDLNMRVRILDHLGSVLGTDAQATEIARQCLVAMIDETRMRQEAHEKGMRRGGQTGRTKWTPEMDELLKKCVAAAEKGGKAVRYAPMVQPLKELAKKQECLVKVGTGTIREHWHRIKPQ
jgi:hypothetical protein